MNHVSIADSEIARCREVTERLYGVALRPVVTWDLRGTTAGIARGVDRILLNGEIAAREGEGFRQTVAHEFAHLVVHRLFPRARPHGGEWAAVMRALGYRADRCHQYEVKKTRFGCVYAYRCACRTYQLTGVRHAKIERGKVYRCLSCGETLVKA